MPFTPYLNVEEVESALAVSALAHPGLCELIELPEASFEGRVSHALRIGAGAPAARPGVLLLGGTHAREWGSSDILVAFAENLVAAYEADSGLVFQGKAYTAAEARRIVECLDLFLFPDVNPDGKAYSQSGFDWRKNRRPVDGAVGVDINRNYDFLWNANAFFDPSLSFSYLYSPASSNYHGPAPFSESESRNVRWLLDHYPQICWFADLHSFGQKIMCVWGDDENQGADPEESFANAAFDGQRGLPADAYGEFIFADDDQKQARAASRMRDAIFAVRGSSYSVGQIYDQVGVSAGDSAPYAFSRHIASGAPLLRSAHHLVRAGALDAHRRGAARGRAGGRVRGRRADHLAARGRRRDRRALLPHRAVRQRRRSVPGSVADRFGRRFHALHAQWQQPGVPQRGHGGRAPGWLGRGCDRPPRLRERKARAFRLRDRHAAPAARQPRPVQALPARARRAAAAPAQHGTCRRGGR